MVWRMMRNHIAAVIVCAAMMMLVAGCVVESPDERNSTGQPCDSGYTAVEVSSEVRRRAQPGDSSKHYLDILRFNAENNREKTEQCARSTGNPPVTYALRINTFEELREWAGKPRHPEGAVEQPRLPRPTVRPTPTPVPAHTPVPTHTPVPVPAWTPAPTGEPKATGAGDVTALPIWVKSTTNDYFVLYARYGDAEYPVLVKMGEGVMTTLAENIPMLEPERYWVERYSISNPGDADGDGIGDIIELGSLGLMSPVNSAPVVRPEDGTAFIADADSFKQLGILLNGYRTVKFVVFGLQQGRPGVVFVNARTHDYHDTLVDAVGLKDDPLFAEQVQGYLIHGHVDSMGDERVFHFHLLDRDIDYDTVDRVYTALAANIPAVKGSLMMWVRNYQVPHVQPQLPLYRESRIPLLFNADVYGRRSFEVLNPGTAYGLLRFMTPEDRPHPRDIVIYETLPNNLPLVSGVITTVPQTPLSHVNLRAVQNDIPNFYLRDVLDELGTRDLLGSYVRLEVQGGGGYGTHIEYSIRAATMEEVDAHFEDSRPEEIQILERDLSVTGITPLSDIGFDDQDAFGVKAANVAELGKLGFPQGTIPDGFAIPFHFYDEFMQHNGFYQLVVAMLEHPEFQADMEVQRSVLRRLRSSIEDGDLPGWMLEAIRDMNTRFDAAFGEGLNRRYRSSTNNEDLPGFNGAGLYDSKSQKPSEDREDLAKSLKQVYASLWSYRAFIEREFHRVDHMTAAMGVLVHPSYRNELVNGVAASFDPTPGAGEGTYYVNSQLGEDMVTNPEAYSLPEELRLGEGLAGGRGYEVIKTSSLLEPGTLLMTGGQIEQLRLHLAEIHNHFHGLYGPAPGERFAMEIEFKITSDNRLAIKQARPWVFPARHGGAE